MQETRLRKFCLRYWGRGDEGRREIYETRDISVPYLNDCKYDEAVLGAIGESDGESEDDVDDESESGSRTDKESDGESEDDVDDESESGSGTDEDTDEGHRTSAPTSTVPHTTLSLGPDFKGFFPKHDKILVRDEYPTMLNHIKLMQKRGCGGVVLTGQPGIGKELTQFTERS